MTGLHPYQYNATIERVIDGDTLVLSLDLGFGIWLHRQTFRLVGINARELREIGGADAAAYLRMIAPPGTTCTISSVKNDKYGGRYDARIALPDIPDVASHLVERGWASAWNGTGPKPTPTWPRLNPPG